MFNPVLMVVQGALRGSVPFIAEHEGDPGKLAPVVRDSRWPALAAVPVAGAGGLAPVWTVYAVATTGLAAGQGLAF